MSYYHNIIIFIWNTITAWVVHDAPEIIHFRKKMFYMIQENRNRYQTFIMVLRSFLSASVSPPRGETFVLIAELYPTSIFLRLHRNVSYDLVA